jgi:hypothetical protein
MNALTLFILCTVLIVSSGLLFPEKKFDNCSNCIAHFDKYKEGFKKVCPRVDEIYQGFKVRI